MRPIGAMVTTGGSVIALVGTFLPWLRSGARDRSSYVIFDLVDRLGFAPGGIVAWSLRLWPLVPLLLTVVVVLAWWPTPGRRLRGAALGTAVVAALWVGGTGLAINLAPDAGLFRLGLGPTVAVVGAVLLTAGSVIRRRESAAWAAS